MKKILLITMLIPLFITVIVFFIANSAPDYSADRLPLEDEETANTLIEIVQNYKKDMIEATNNGDFGDIEHYLVNNHTYRNVRAYMNQLQGTSRKKLELMDQTIEDVSYYYLDEVMIYCVDVTETVKLTEVSKEEVEKQELRYEFINHNDQFKIESIVQSTEE